MEAGKSSTSVSNGCVDYKGRIADKQATGGWKASPFVIVNEVAERLAFFAIAVNMVNYMVRELHQPLPEAATHVTDWIGAAHILALLGAFLADAYLGRFRTIIIFSCIYAVGMVVLTISASVDSLRPPYCPKKPCIPASSGQTAFLYCALALIALGTGGIKPCISSFGADQFDESDTKEAPKNGVWVGLGFGIPTAAMIISIVILSAGFSKYRYQKPVGSAFTRFVQVIVVSLRNHVRGVEVGREADLYEVETRESDIRGAKKLPHTEQYRFLDKAAVITDPECNTKNRWRLCTVTQVEELKSFVRVLPVWASTIALGISFAQLSTFFIQQANIMDRKIGPHFEIPSGSIAVFTALNGQILVPIYEKLVVPFLRAKTGHPRGITSLQRMGIGLFVSIFAMVPAALVEKKRRDHSSDRLSIFWLFPQFFLVGTAEVFTYVGQLEFFYDEATDGMRSINSAIFLSEIGIGSWLSTAIVKIVESATGGLQDGWLRNDLNASRLDYFYWILTGVNAVNFLVYLWVARRYKGRNGGGRSVRDESAVEELVRNKENADDKGEFRSQCSPIWWKGRSS
ncbi:UNVERIFIED_CONTAM: protein NRT1/ PTR FAMILY 8.1 [Sesamum radiatum]|uniref:Protein NRT1/ PTR FAMILY 8.1 n=1 Tax=Sesamum radiatum TaxID=300843 RepID=A0AAW2M1Y2_SESRA